MGGVDMENKGTGEQLVCNPKTQAHLHAIVRSKTMLNLEYVSTL